METVENGAAESAAQRDGRGRWAPGQSGNPAGKPPGTRNFASILKAHLRDGDIEAAVQVIRDKLLAGNLGAARVVLDRLDPKPRGRPIALDLPADATAADAIRCAIDLMWAGEISSDEARPIIELSRRRPEVEPAPAAEVPVQPNADAVVAAPAVAAVTAAASPESDLNFQVRKPRGGVASLAGRPASARRLRRALLAATRRAASATAAAPS
ncbi:MAG: hypothetical protein HY060_10020 [Proteobacteria bacterium]|nr:hypothetical protein [Pseudomonadota bacterium]